MNYFELLLSILVHFGCILCPSSKNYLIKVTSGTNGLASKPPNNIEAANILREFLKIILIDIIKNNNFKFNRI